MKHFGGASGEPVKQAWGLPGLVMFLHWSRCAPSVDGYRENFPAEDSVGGGDSPSLRGGRRVCRRAGRGRGRGAGGHRPVGRAPSPLTSESLPQTRLSSPAPPAGRRKAPGKRPLWGTLFLGSVYLSAASGSVRALCPTPLPADQRSARRQQRPLRGWLRARPASALPAPPLPAPPPAPPRRLPVGRETRARFTTSWGVGVRALRRASQRRGGPAPCGRLWGPR